MTNVVFVGEFLWVGGGWWVCKPNLVISDELITITESNWSVVYLSLEDVLHIQRSGHN